MPVLSKIKLKQVVPLRGSGGKGKDFLPSFAVLAVQE